MIFRSRVLTGITLVLGILLFAYTLYSAGPVEVLSRVRSLGWGLPAIIVISAFRILVRAIAWRHCIPIANRSVGLKELIAARLIGDAAGHLTPAGLLASEPARLLVLANKLPIEVATHSLAVETLTYTMTSCVMVLAGTMTLLASFAVSEDLRTLSLIAFGGMFIVLVVVTLIVVRRWTLLTMLGEMMRKVLHMAGFSRRWKQHVEMLRRLEHHVLDYYRGRPIEFVIVNGYEGLFHLAGVAETWTALYCLGAKPNLMTAFTLEATNRAINMLFSFVPARVGVDEAGSALLTSALGMGTATGVALAIVRKVRVLFWTAVGLIVFASFSRENAKTATKT